MDPLLYALTTRTKPPSFFSCFHNLHTHPFLYVFSLTRKVRLYSMRSLLVSSWLFVAGISQVAATPAPATCKCFPGDACWPSDAEWSKLNKTVSGRLVATVPIGSPCHDPHYDAAACQALQDEWLYSSVQ